MRVDGKQWKKKNLRIIEKSCLFFFLRNKVCDMQSLFPGFWKFQTETVSQLNGTYKASQKEIAWYKWP